jgi:hypothetical protein
MMEATSSVLSVADDPNPDQVGTATHVFALDSLSDTNSFLMRKALCSKRDLLLATLRCLRRRVSHVRL